MPTPEASTPSTVIAHSRPAILKLALAMFLPAVLLFSALLYGLLKNDAISRLQKLQVQEAGEVNIAEQLLTHDFDAVVTDLHFLANAPSLKHFIDNASPSEKQRITEHFLNMAKAKQRYNQIRYLDNSGMEIIRVNMIDKQPATVEHRKLQNKADRYFFKETLKLEAGDTYISPLDLNVEQGQVELPYKPMLRFGTPLFNRAGKKQGILLINYYGQKLLDDFTQAMRDKHHAMLLNQEGYWLSSPDPALEWGFMFGRNDTLGKHHPEAWAKISTEQRGNLFAREGLYTFSSIQPLQNAHPAPVNKLKAAAKPPDKVPAKSYSWKIVSLVPGEELPAVSPAQYPRSFALYFLSLILLALLALYLSATLLSRRQLRAAIFENESHLKEITATIAEGIYVVNSHGLTTFINPEGAQLLGWAPADLMGLHAHNLFHYRKPDGSPLPADDCEIYQVIQTGCTYRSDTQVFWRKDGTPLHVEVSASPILREGKTMGAVVAFSDISMQKQAEAALLHSERQLKQAQRMAQLGSWELDLVTQELAWSDEIYRIFEIEPGTFGASYEAFLDLIHPQDRERVNLAYHESIQNHTTYSIEHRLLFAHDRIKYVIEHGETLYDDKNHPLRSIGTVQDISERYATQEALRTSKETARTLLNATSESAILMNTSGIVVAINRVGASRLHKRPEEIIGKNIYDFLPADIAASRKKIMEEVARSGHPSQFEEESNGMHLDQSVYPILDAHGMVSQIAIYATDITERIKLQAEEILLQHIDQQVLRSSSLSGLLQFICDEVVQLFGFHFAWLGKKEAGGDLTISAQSGNASAYLQDLLRIGVSWDETPQGRGPTGACIRSGQIQVFKISDKSFLPWRDAAERFGFASIAGIPLIVRGQVYGALMLYSEIEHGFDETSTLQRLSGIARRICVALEMAMDQEQLRLLSTALASAENGVFITDAIGKIMWINNAFTRLTGYSSDEAIGKSPALLNSGEQDEDYYHSLWQSVQHGKTWSNETVERHKSGKLFTVQQTITPIKNDDGVVSHFVSILDDISAQKEAAARIQHMAHFDALTALPNRALFRDRLSQVLAQAKREGNTCALMFIDLDRFKAVNDTFGHHIGDLLLKAVAERLRNCVRESDTLSRLAGDEFTVLLTHVHGREDVTAIANKITESLATHFVLDGHEINIGSSTGIAFYPSDAISDDALLKCADHAMYLAKESGRGTFRFYQTPAP